MNRKRFEQITTPQGKAIYPWLTEPDRKFNPDGEYKINLRLNNEKAEEVINQLEDIYEKHYAECCKEQGKKKLKRHDLPCVEVTGDNEELTGEWDFKFKLKAKWKSRDGKEGTQRPILYDAKNNPLTNDNRPKVGSGSTVRISAEVYTWFTPTLGVGMSLRPKAVQILELIEYGGGGSAKGFGFEVEEGFEALASEMSSSTSNANEVADEAFTDDMPF